MPIFVLSSILKFDIGPVEFYEGVPQPILKISNDIVTK